MLRNLDALRGRTGSFGYCCLFLLLTTCVAFYWIGTCEYEADVSSSSATIRTGALAIGSVGQGGFVATHAVSGSVFRGLPYRKYTGSHIFREGWRERVGKTSLDWETITSKYFKKGRKTQATTKTCIRWAVVTTIFEPNEAISGVAALKGWCMVIVADNKTPLDYLEQGKGLVGNDSIFFFSVREQKQWLNLPGEMGAFYRGVPYDHFARKNLGFLYAILQGAEFIYDFDDDNFINKDSGAGNLLPLISNEAQIENVRFVSVETLNFNHHPLMGATIPGSWPRGFPMESIQDTKTHGTVVSSGNTVPMTQVGVIQYCADNNPDIDAVHRLVLPLPMNYRKEPDSTPVLVPTNTFVPYNAQATLHTKDSLWATLLPITVKGRVSDIWRSYFAQCLFKDLDLGVVFVPPRITQYRNAHSLIGDMNAEGDLYFKAERLSDFVSNWKSSLPSIPARMEALWIDLYERGYLEEDDVKMVQLWLGALVQIGYHFRTPKQFESELP
jgi:hypothetical protein